MKDSCTGMGSEWAITQKINECCLQHDVDYVEQIKTKTQADMDFYECVSGEVDVISALLIGVCAAIGGVWFWYRRKIKCAGRT